MFDLFLDEEFQRGKLVYPTSRLNEIVWLWFINCREIYDSARVKRGMSVENDGQQFKQFVQVLSPTSQ